MKAPSSKTIFFITGAFVGHNCWDLWVGYFESQGYTCIVHPWPFKDAPVAVLKSRQPDYNIAGTRLGSLVDYYAERITYLPERPIIIGHSIGGLIVQLLLQRNLASAGVAIHPVAPQGVITISWSMMKSVWGPLGFFTSVRKSYMMSLKSWKYIFTNGMSEDDQVKSYSQYAIPESKLVSRDGLTSAARLDFTRAHVPLLITSGSDDHIVPAALNFANYKKYSDADSVTEYKEFKGRNHFVLGQSTWKLDAEYILKWLKGSCTFKI